MTQTTARPGCPIGATFSGSLTITPVKGAAIACTLTNTALPPDLGLTKTGPSSLTVGAVTSYTLVVTNSGGQTGGTTVDDQLPANIEFVSASGTGWTCTASGDVTTGQTLACTGPAIPVTAVVDVDDQRATADRGRRQDRCQ